MKPIHNWRLHRFWVWGSYPLKVCKNCGKMSFVSRDEMGRWEFLDRLRWWWAGLWGARCERRGGAGKTPAPSP